MLSCLEEHPEVFVPPYEINYFSYDYQSSASSYKTHFQAARMDHVIGEKSPSYLAHPEAAERIYDWNPEIHLIFSLRHPVERAYAMYCMLLQNPRSNLGINIARELTPTASMVQDGRYFEHLQRYRKYFPEDQLHILVFDDLKDDAEKFARLLFETVGVHPLFEPSLLRRKYGHRKKRGGLVWSYIQELSIRLSRKSKMVNRFVRWVRRNGYTEWIHRWRPGKDYPKLTVAVRERLNEYYQDDVDRLRSYLKRDLSGWPGDGSQ